MSAANDPSVDRDTYRHYAAAYWSAIKLGDAELANRQTEAGDFIVAKWRDSGRLSILLEQLLDDTSAEIRYAAASDLLGSELSERAVAVLETLQTDPKGFVAPTARLRLTTWRREHL